MASFLNPWARAFTAQAAGGEDEGDFLSSLDPMTHGNAALSGLASGAGRLLSSALVPSWMRPSFSRAPSQTPASDVRNGAVEPQPEAADPANRFRMVPVGPSLPAPAAPTTLEQDLNLGPPANTDPSPMRAIRMPGGRLLFTNRDEYGGEEFSTAEGGRLVREAQRAQPLEATNPLVADPTSRTLRALVRASAMRPETGPAPTSGRMVPGVQPDADGAALSMIEGTPQQRTALQLEDAIGALGLANANQQLEVASMPAAERSVMENRDVQTASFLLGQFLPRIKTVQDKLRIISTPGDPQFIADDRQRALHSQEIKDELTMLQNLMSVLMGVRPSTT